MKETWIKLCLELNFIQDEGKKCIQMRQDIENFEVMQICMRSELFKWNTILTAYRVSIVTHNELRTSAPKSFDEVWVQDNTASSSWPGLSNETKNVRLTVTTFDFLGFKNSRGLHLSEERYLERFLCLKFIIRFFILLGITVM